MIWLGVGAAAYWLATREDRRLAEIEEELAPWWQFW